ncbi:DNA-binding protein [Devosia aurantiaca]|uniref:KfrA N-terminal DNA-binding domain-containing protein n=1 Tax=Devosia aurantiaca TaxID=2714858 RepID=A0A6M1S9Q2_9HYPH|nr:DNA-binding protein [Devosia aurantiaca]NGP16537.1 hypothetical protein [Devosia aurantiaca]
MSNQIATFERVRDVVETLRKRNVAPTADRVIAMVGGGSKSTVLSHLKRLRDAPMDDDAIPPSVMDAARVALNEVYLAGRSAEADTVRAATERLSQAVREQDAQIEELAGLNERLEWSKAQLIKQLKAVKADHEAAVERAEALAKENDGLRSELAVERQNSQTRVQDTLARVERLLTPSSTGPDVARPDRKTLGLPAKLQERRG